MENTSKIARAVAPVFTEHLDRLRQAMAANQDKRLRLEGSIRLLETEFAAMQKHHDLLQECLKEAEKPQTPDD